MSWLAVGIALAHIAFPPTVRGALDAELLEEYKNAIVRTKIAGRAGSRTCEKFGTGFFVSRNGYILTAGHNVTPCSEGLGPDRWDRPPTLTVDRLSPGPGTPLDELKAVVIYVDTQTDLALLRAAVHEAKELPLAGPHSLSSGETEVLVFEADQAAPAERSVQVDSEFNPGENHRGLIDIAGPAMNPSASGGPLFDHTSFVAGVFTKGRDGTGEGVVPISFAAPLFQMIGISYPSGEVREVIEELRRDLINWSVKHSEGDLVVTYTKRLKAGLAPVLLQAEIEVYTEKGRFPAQEERAFILPDSVTHEGPKGKNGKVVFSGIGKKIDDQIAVRNKSGSSFGEKARALVTIHAEFNDGLRITPIRGDQVKF